MTRPLLLALAGAALLTACSDSPSPSPLPSTTPSTSAPVTTAPAPPTPAAPTAGATAAPSSAAPDGTTAAATAPAFRADTRPDTAEPSGGPLTVVAVRAARQAGYDRVVLELRGKQAGVPGWRVGYVASPTQQGSGRQVDVAGSAVLQVVVTGVGYPFDTGQQEASTDLMPKDTRVVREVDLQATYEGQFQAFVGLSAQRPFRVFRLSDPARVVIDVRHT